MAVRDQRPLDRPDRIDVEAAGRAAQAGGVGTRRSSGRMVLDRHHSVVRRCSRTASQSQRRAALAWPTACLPCSSGDLIADRRYACARDWRRAATCRPRPICSRRRSSSRRVLPPRGSRSASRAKRSGERAGAVGAFRQALRRRSAGPSWRGPAPGAARRAAPDRRRCRRLCPRAVRSVCRAVRRRADAAARLSRAATAAGAAVEHARAASGRRAFDARSISAAAPGLAGAASGRRRRLVGVDLSSAHDRHGARQAVSMTGSTSASCVEFLDRRAAWRALRPGAGGRCVRLCRRSRAVCRRGARARAGGLLAFTVETHAGDGRHARREAALRPWRRPCPRRARRRRA